MEVGPFIFESASFHATAVSAKFAGLHVVIFGVERKVVKCSIGWCVGPSSPSAIES